MKPTDASPAHHHHAPEEMHNEDVAHEHSDINIRAVVWLRGHPGRRRDRVAAS